MKKRRVLFVIDTMNVGGAEKSLLSLLPLLDYERMTVDLLIVHRGGLFEQYLPQSIRIISVPAVKGFRKFFKVICQLVFSVWLKSSRLMGSQRHGAEMRWQVMRTVTPPLEKYYDVAVSYHQGFPTYYVATKVNANKKYAWVNTDLASAGYKDVFNRPFYDYYDRIIAVSERLRNLLEDTEYVDKTRLETIYDILNPDMIRRMAKVENITEVLKGKILRIVTVGRMIALKNYAMAVEVAKRLKDAGLSFRWYFVGDGPERCNVVRLIEQYGLQEHITLLGTQANPYPYMAGCDIYVQTSRFEGFCLTLREARILNKPVVSTDFSVVHDQIHDGENGLIAKMTPESVAEKILLLAANPALREKLIAATRCEKDMTAKTEVAKVNEILLAG